LERNAPPSGARFVSVPFPPMLPTRTEALALVHEFTQGDSLRKHMLAVESAMRAYARKFGEDEDRWGLAGLVHDFDYERYPNAAHSATEEHPAWGVNHLRSLGWPDDILTAILGHAQYSGVPREPRMAKTLFALDGRTGRNTGTAPANPTQTPDEVDGKPVRREPNDMRLVAGV